MFGNLISTIIKILIIVELLKKTKVKNYFSVFLYTYVATIVPLII